MCEETSNSSEGMWFPCREGYVCDFATTPDVDLLAPASQFTHVCPPGYRCQDGTGLGQAERFECEEDFFVRVGLLMSCLAR